MAESNLPPFGKMKGQPMRIGLRPQEVAKNALGYVPEFLKTKNPAEANAPKTIAVSNSIELDALARKLRKKPD